MSLLSVSLAALSLLVPQARATEAVWIEGEDPTLSNTFNQHNWYSAVRGELLSPATPSDPAHPGGWRAHFTNEVSSAQASWLFSTAEAGTHTVWARVGAYRVNMAAQLDGGEIIDLDLDHQAREKVNLVEPILDLRYIAWVKVGTFDLAAGSHTLTFSLDDHPDWPAGPTYGGVDAFVVTNVPHWAPTGALKPGTDGFHEGTADAWFPFLANDGGGEGSVMDVSAALPRPAGAGGRPHREGDAFALDDGSPIRFWGVNVGSLPGTAALREEQSRFYARNGINAVRLHSVQSWLGAARDASGAPAFDAERLDALDHWIAALAAEGIYVDLSVFYSFTSFPGDGTDATLDAELPAVGGGRNTSGVATFRADVQDAESRWLSALLAHRNPYTGRTYAEEPSIALVELRNEDSIFWHAPLNTLAAGTDLPRHTALLQREWAAWLRTRYASDTELLAAWGPTWGGSRPGDSLANEAMYLYAAWELGADGPTTNPVELRRAGDWVRFLAETQAEGYRRREAALRAAGFDGIVVSTGWMAGGAGADLANLWTDATLDAIDRHAYVGGGAGVWRVTTGAVDPWSHFDHPGEGPLGEGLYQVADLPFLMTEWGHVTPDPWKLEGATVQALYGMGLQGWDATFHFSASSPWWRTGWPDLTSYVTETPHVMGLFPALSTAVREGHVQEGSVVASRHAGEGAWAGLDARVHPGGGNGFGGGDSLDIDGRALLRGRVTTSFDAGASTTTDLGDLTGVIESVTGELAWDVDGRFATVSSDRTQGVIGFTGTASGRTHTLPDASLTVRTSFATILITAMDGAPLATSRRILLTALARDQQTGAVYNADDTELLATGGPPLLLEPVQADIVMGGAPLARVQGLSVNGLPQVDVPLDGNAFTIDGRWKTAWYLLERDSSDTFDTSDTPDSIDDAKAGGCACSTGSSAAWGGGGDPLRNASPGALALGTLTLAAMLARRRGHRA